MLLVVSCLFLVSRSVCWGLDLSEPEANNNQRVIRPRKKTQHRAVCLRQHGSCLNSLCSIHLSLMYVFGVLLNIAYILRRNCHVFNFWIFAPSLHNCFHHIPPAPRDVCHHIPRVSFTVWTYVSGSAILLNCPEGRFPECKSIVTWCWQWTDTFDTMIEQMLQAVTGSTRCSTRRFRLDT